MFLGCPKKSRVQIHRGTSYSTLLAKTRGLSVGVRLVWVPFPPHVIWEDSWEAPSGPLIQLPLWDFHSLSFFTGCSCTWPCRARPEVVSGESPSTLLDRGCLTWLITLSKGLASCFSTEVLTGGVGAGPCEWGGETWPSGEAVVEAVLITLATPTLHSPRNSCDFPHAYTLRNWDPGRWRSVPNNNRARLWCQCHSFGNLYSEGHVISQDRTPFLLPHFPFFFLQSPSKYSLASTYWIWIAVKLRLILPSQIN